MERDTVEVKKGEKKKQFRQTKIQPGKELTLVIWRVKEMKAARMTSGGGTYTSTQRQMTLRKLTKY